MSSSLLLGNLSRIWVPWVARVRLSCPALSVLFSRYSEHIPTCNSCILDLHHTPHRNPGCHTEWPQRPCKLQKCSVWKGYQPQRTIRDRLELGRGNSIYRNGPPSESKECHFNFIHKFLLSSDNLPNTPISHLVRTPTRVSGRTKYASAADRNRQKGAVKEEAVKVQVVFEQNKAQLNLVLATFLC